MYAALRSGPSEFKMQICIFGAGAIGGYLAVRLARRGHDISVIARGAHLAAIRDSGLRLIEDGIEHIAKVVATDDPSQLGPQALVICSLKAHQAWQNAEAFAPLLGPDTPVLAAMNGFPWWYFYEVGGRLKNTSLDAVDRDARQWRAIGPQRAIGCVVEPACEVVSPGVILHRKYKRFQLGEPDGSKSVRIETLSNVLIDAGLEAPVRTNVRNHVWLKLFGNACFNPISLLTGATIDRVTTEPGLRTLCKTIILEARSVAIELGEEVPEEMIERRLDAAARMVGHKMSMLQDFERGRELELDALVEAVAEAGRLAGVPTPNLDFVLALARERERTAALC